MYMASCWSMGSVAVQTSCMPGPERANVGLKPTPRPMHSPINAAISLWLPASCVLAPPRGSGQCLLVGTSCVQSRLESTAC